MKKILFILNYRAGINLFLFTNGMKEVPFTASQKTKEIVGGKELINPEGLEIPSLENWTGSKEAFWLPTIPERICPCESYWISNIENTLQKNPISEYFSWYTTIGNWWGEVKSHTEVPEPYDINTPVKFGASDLALLPGNNWKFIYITRDGRNQLSSLRNIPGGIEQEYNKKDPQDYFQVLCKTYRNKARIALDCHKYLDNFKIIKFENLISNCIGTIKEIYNFIELPLNEEYITKAYELTLSRREQHSSFTTKDYNERWKSWTTWEIEIFKKIAGKELEEMGYIWD